MQKASYIFDQIIIYLPEIKQTLNEAWPAFMTKLQSQTALFENVSDESGLDAAANQLLGIFVADNVIVEIMTRPVSNGVRFRHYLDNHEPQVTIELEGDRNKFVMLCRNPNEFLDQNQLKANDEDENKIEEDE